MYQKLTDIAMVISGYTFRKAVQPDSSGGVYLVQASNIRKGIVLDSLDGLQRIEDNLIGYKGDLLNGDVLLVAKGQKLGAYRSAVFKIDDSANRVIASSSLFVLRTESLKILPEFLSLYLNSDVGQNSLLEIASGGSLCSLPKKVLEQINVPVLPIAKQKTLINLQNNIGKQIELLTHQISLKESIINASFQELTAN